MTKLDLEEKYIDFIKNTVRSVLSSAEIYVFGSRVQDNAQKYSDVDIALRCTEIIDIKDILKLKTIFRESVFPYKVDIIDLSSVDKNFYKIIKADLHKIN